MPRILNDAPCILVLDDRISNSKIVLQFRMPTTDERVKYANSLVTRRGSKIEYNYSATRVKFGMEVLLGFDDGAFNTAENKPLSSRPESPDYEPNWKDFVQKYAADIVELLAIHVFELSVVKAPDAGSNGGETREADENPT